MIEPLRTYASNIGAPEYIKQILMYIKRETDSNTVIIEDFNTPLTTMDRPSRQNDKEMVVLNDTLDQMTLSDIFRVFCPKAAEYTFFSSAYGTFSRKNYLLGLKTSLKFKKIEIISSIFVDYSGMKLKINHKKRTEKHKIIETK